MMPFRRARPSIERRLVVAALSAYLLVWAVVAAIAVTSPYRAGSGDFDRELSGFARVIDAILADPALPPAPALRGLALKLSEDGRRAGVPDAHLGFQVHDAAGTLLAQGGAAFPALADDGRRGLFDVDAGGASWRFDRRLVAAGARRIDVAQSRQVRASIVRASILNVMTLAQLLAGLPLLAFPIWLAVRTGIAPLLRLSQALRARPPGDLAPLAIDAPHRELVPLVDALDATLERLSELLQRERAFLADAAHELRTPLAVIATQYDTLRRAPAGPDRDAAMDRLGLGVARSARLVNQLLSLARLEAHADAGPTAVDLADIVRDCLAMHASDAAQRGIELAYHGRDSLVVRCQAQAVDTIVQNLVSNAMRHGRRGGRVDVGLEQDGARDLVLDVADDGPGIDAAQRERAFDRFWQGRKPGSSASGAGLGLAIVRAAARQLDAHVALSDGLEGRGLRVTLRWRPENA
jgi:two-component system, OmpR family, sensor histidine kinase QseC